MSASVRPGRVRSAAAPPLGWVLGASAFNWTPDMVRAERSAADIVVGVVADGVAETVEIEAGQVWRGFPDPADAEVDELRDALTAAGGRVGVVGASIDDFAPSGRRRDDGERMAFLLPQLRAAHQVGATGVRLPLGQAGRPLLERLLPVLHERKLTLFEEFQGQQSPLEPRSAAAFETVAVLDDPRVRLLCDISLLMPALPTTYLEVLDRAGLDRGLLRRLTDAWRDPGTLDAVRSALGSDAVPAAVRTLFMNLLVRFGRSDAADLRGVAPLIGGVHLKFWDLDDADGRVSVPIRDIAAVLHDAGFNGTLTSEWGGHEWLSGEQAAELTRRHLALAGATIGSVLTAG